MSIKKKILAGFSILLILIAVPTGYSIVSGFSIQRNVKTLHEKIYTSLDLTNSLIEGLRKTRESLTISITESDEEAIKEAQNAAVAFNKHLDELKAVTGDEELDTLDGLYAKYLEKGVLVAQTIVRGGDMAAVAKDVASLNDTANSLSAMLKQYHERYYASFVSNIEEVKDLSGRSMTLALGAFVVAFILGGCIAVFLSSRISSGIKEVENRINEIAHGDGDLTKRLAVKANDEMGLLAAGFNSFVDNLKRIIADVAGFTTKVAASSEQLSSACEEMKNSIIKEQLSLASQVATSSEQMSASINDVAKNCSGAAEAAREADLVAARSSEVIARTIEGMHGIALKVGESASQVELLNKRADEIGKIIDVIDDIADQTNLLALNAAIEAARAGEQGRGFAVVADEVRRLSERTINATKEISSTIKSIQSETRLAVSSMESSNCEVESHVVLANDARSALNEILSKVRNVNDMIARIASAVEEQSTASEQICADMDKVAGLTRATSSMTEEMAQASRDLSDLGTGLKKVVTKFKVEDAPLEQGEPREKSSKVVTAEFGRRVMPAAVSMKR